MTSGKTRVRFKLNNTFGKEFSTLLASHMLLVKVNNASCYNKDNLQNLCILLMIKVIQHSFVEGSLSFSDSRTRVSSILLCSFIIIWLTGWLHQGRKVGSMLALESSEWEVTYDFCSHSHLPELTPLSPAQLKRMLGNINKHNDLCWRLFVLAHLTNFILTPGWCDCLIAPEASPYDYILSYPRYERTNPY